ncbi:pollen-specific leucine-rich repeat extensin-like protein 4 [Iris pallida]|uniref:Pollen-specific leucine-rich repeat extensin-like protein 4 n=1 Tax=Iris pallida TaxID=29817 RepID=A0AAX6E5E1_IRIPA|nr:pollen-specific leucine-rich repeat extensin-like protein 4 [Iris pallida]
MGGGSVSVVRWRDGHGGDGCSRGWPRLRGDGRTALDVEAGEGTSHRGSAEEDVGGRAAPHGRCVGLTARRDGGRRHSKGGGVGIGRFGMGSRRRQWNRSRRRHTGSRSGGTKEPDRPVTLAPARRGRAVGIRGRRRRWLEPSGRSSWLAVGW